MRGTMCLGEESAKKVVEADAEVAAVSAELRAGDHDLLHALGLALLRLIDHPGDGLRALTAAGPRDDAEGADVVAAFLGGDEGARLEGLPRQ